MSVATFQRALDIDQNYIDAYVNLAVVYQAMGELDKTAQCYQKAVELDSSHGPATHMLAALRGKHTKAAPPEHVAQLFDEYAVRFDHHLVDTLGYSMPGLLRDEIHRLQGEDAGFNNVIDLCCGTGLAGIAFHTLSFVEITHKLLFHKPVEPLNFLLFTKPNTIITVSASSPAMHTWCHMTLTSFHCTLGSFTSGSFQHQFHALSTAILAR